MPTSPHTPGPWHLSQLKAQVGVYTATGEKVAQVPLSSQLWSHSLRATSDARLISAAPDLLAALQQCLVIVDAHRRAAGGEGDVAAMNARAAIARATGEQS